MVRQDLRKKGVASLVGGEAWEAHSTAVVSMNFERLGWVAGKSNQGPNARLPMRLKKPSCQAEEKY